MKSFDTVALFATLSEIAALCRRLELHKHAATFEGFIARFQKEPPTLAALEEASHALNLAALPILMKLKDDNTEFSQLQTALGKVMYPEIYEPKKPDNRQTRKAVGDRKPSGNSMASPC